MSDSPWNFDGESPRVSGSETVTMVDGTTFMVSSRSGMVNGHEAQGLFMLDTRVLSRWTLTISGIPVQPLSVIPNGPFSSTFVGRIDDPKLADAPIAVIQRRHVGRGMREDFEVRNHGAKAQQLTIELDAAADFTSLFDVKAGQPAPRKQHVGVVQLDDAGTGATVVIDSHGPLEGSDSLDGSVVDATIITCSVAPEAITGGRLSWTVALEPGEHWTMCSVVSVAVEGRELEPSYLCGRPIEEAIPVSRLRQWQRQVTTIETNDRRMSVAFDRASEDLGALRIFDPDHPDRVVVAAGAPWFMTLFGRDSILASWMALPLDQNLAIGVLKELADAQGERSNPSTEEQPGRILHEVRFDHRSARLLGGANTYYGTIDATPLFVMLVAELARWTGLTDTVRRLMPAVDRAIDWIDRDGDRDGDGFVEYLRSDPSGLENQGWKDSWDGVRHVDGAVAKGPIALCEVQGYVYAAYRGRADLARALGESEDVSSDFDQRANILRSEFDNHFWLDECGWYALGLDGDKKSIGSLTSNIGHLLWTGIVPNRRSSAIARHFVGSSMFTGWGLRTLSSDNPAYNPLSYHCGSVWPHDTALAVAGLAKYGQSEEANILGGALLDASARNEGRLPELFAGFASDDLSAPVPYPTSCSPQAWAAASPLLVVRSMLGLEPDLLNGRVNLRPRLPAEVTRLSLSNVPIGENTVGITIDSGDIEVTGLDAGIALEIDRP